MGQGARRFPFPRLRATMSDMSRTFSEVMDQHRVDRRAQLLSVAAEVISERGLHMVTMDQVAERAGTSKVVLYRYFGSREKLVHAVLADIVDRLLEGDQEEAPWWTDRVRRTLKLAREHRVAMRLLVRFAAHDQQYGEHFERLNQALIARAMEREQEILGEAGHRVKAGQMLAEAIMSFLLDAYVRWIDEGDPERDEAFLLWLTSSIRSMSYYWHGLDPPAAFGPARE
jgi:AcrR family transcriptional regulator